LPVNIEFVDMPEHLQAKYQYYTCADVAKLRTAGFNGTITELEVAVKDYVQRYLAPGKLLGD
jgi:ADP-L-glycero-D-manno-heptose 6-epimerase